MFDMKISLFLRSHLQASCLFYMLMEIITDMYKNISKCFSLQVCILLFALGSNRDLCITRYGLKLQQRLEKEKIQLHTNQLHKEPVKLIVIKLNIQDGINTFQYYLHHWNVIQKMSFIKMYDVIRNWSIYWFKMLRHLHTNTNKVIKNDFPWHTHVIYSYILLYYCFIKGELDLILKWKLTKLKMNKKTSNTICRTTKKHLCFPYFIPFHDFILIFPPFQIMSLQMIVINIWS